MFAITKSSASIAAICVLATMPSLCAHADALRSYAIDKKGISVSGISSGGNMAQQFHVIHSGEIMGAGIVAGGPYNCANSGSDPVTMAMTVCSRFLPNATFMGPSNVGAAIEATLTRARQETIDPTDNLSRSRVLLFSGTTDRIVPQSVVDGLERYYEDFISFRNIRYVNNIPAAHAMVTDSYGNDCMSGRNPNAKDPNAPAAYLPYITDCGYDLAGEILRFIYGDRYGDLNLPGDDQKGQLIAFDQAEFLPAEPISMDGVGYVFVPPDCQTGGCRLHIAFHGCQQDQHTVGDAYYRHAGYNRWAITNRIIVLYPQLVASTANPVNPLACWDWWGYTGSDYDTRSGKQIVAVQEMIDRLSGGEAK